MNKEAIAQLNEMRSLISRMDKKEKLYESVDKLDARGRSDVDTSDFFDLIGGIKGGIKSTIGYISVAKVNVPVVKRKNPDTGKMKGYPDWSAFGKQLGTDQEVTTVIRFIVYNLNFRTPQNMTKHYNQDFVANVNKIRDQYGMQHMANREPYTTTQDFGNGIATYSGKNDQLKGHSYSPQDVSNAKILFERYYMIGTEGQIVKELSKDEIKPYLQHKGPDGIRAWREIGRSDDEFKEYADQIAALNFRYANFEHSSVVFVITSVNGERKRMFNQNLATVLQGYTVDTSKFTEIAKEMYKIADEKTKDDEIGEVPDEFSDMVDNEF